MTRKQIQNEIDKIKCKRTDSIKKDVKNLVKIFGVDLTEKMILKYFIKKYRIVQKESKLINNAMWLGYYDIFKKKYFAYIRFITLPWHVRYISFFVALIIRPFKKTG